jgi:hypothetical protein
MMVHLVHHGGESQIQKERRRRFLGRIDGIIFVISWEWILSDISQEKQKSQNYEPSKGKR